MRFTFSRGRAAALVTFATLVVACSGDEDMSPGPSRGAPIWAKVISGDEDPLGESFGEQVRSLAAEPGGGVVAVGIANAVIADNDVTGQKDPFGADLLVGAYDGSGEERVIPRFVEAASDLAKVGFSGESIALDPSSSDDIVIAGSLAGSVSVENCKIEAEQAEGDAFLAAFSHNGKCSTLNGIGGTSKQRAHAVGVGKNRVRYVGGEYDKNIELDGMEVLGDTQFTSNGFVVASTPDSATAWYTTFYGEGSQVVRTLGVLPEGDVVVAGTYTKELKVGDEDPRKSKAGTDIFVARLSGDKGAVQWLWTDGGVDEQVVTHLAIGPGGQIGLVGAFRGKFLMDNLGKERLISADTKTGDADAFVIVFAADGTVQWARSFTGEGRQVASSVAFDRFGPVVVAGWFDGILDPSGVNLTSAGELDTFVVKLVEKGDEVLWARAFGGSGDQQVLSLAVNEDRSTYVGGTFNGTLKFDEKLLFESPGRWNGFVAMLAP